MRVITVLLLSFFAFALPAQSITLRVLGQSTFVEEAEAAGILLSFSDADLAQEKKTFLAAVADAGITGELRLLEGNNPTQRTYRFEVRDNSPELFNDLLLVCNQLSKNISKFYYKHPPHSYADEDRRAIMALENAAAQAAIVAKNLDCKVERILNIDDETTFADPLFDVFDFDSEEGESIVRVLELLTNLDSRFKEYSSNPGETKGYNLWVTYELRPK